MNQHLLSLRRLRTRRKLPPRPTVDLADGAPSGLTLAGGVRLTFAQLQAYKAEQMRLFDAARPTKRLLYQLQRDRHYKPK